MWVQIATSFMHTSRFCFNHSFMDVEFFLVSVVLTYSHMWILKAYLLVFSQMTFTLFINSTTVKSNQILLHWENNIFPLSLEYSESYLSTDFNNSI